MILDREPTAIIGGSREDVQSAQILFEQKCGRTTDETADMMVLLAHASNLTVIAWHNNDVLVATPNTRASRLMGQWHLTQYRRDFRREHPSVEETADAD